MGVKSILLDILLCYIVIIVILFLGFYVKNTRVWIKLPVSELYLMKYKLSLYLVQEAFGFKSLKTVDLLTFLTAG